MSIEQEIDRRVEIYRQHADFFGSFVGWVVVSVGIVVLTLITLIGNAWDMNLDGDFTIADVWSAFIEILTLPGNLFIFAIPEGFWTFFEVQQGSPSIWISLILSGFIYMVIAGLVMGVVSWAFVSYYRIRLSWHLKPRLRDHLLPGDVWMLSLVGAVVAVFLWLWFS